jgi:hypothetical protein
MERGRKHIRTPTSIYSSTRMQCAVAHVTDIVIQSIIILVHVHVDVRFWDYKGLGNRLAC